MTANEIMVVVMFLGVSASLLVGFPVAFSLAGASLLFGLAGYAFDLFSPSFFGFFPNRIFGVMTNEVLIAVPLFVYMGVMLERSKVAEELLDTMGMLFGTLRGGLGISVCVVGALLAASTGIVGATVVTMGLLSLPTMLRRGYDARLACGTISASGTLGQIIPPSIVLVVLGDQISNAYQEAQRELGNFAPEPVSVGDLFAGALIPGLALVGLYILWIIIVSFVKPEAAPPVPRSELGDDVHLVRRVAHALVAPIVLIVAVLGSILGGVATPTEAAGVGAIGATLLGGHRQRPDRPLPIYVAAALPGARGHPHRHGRHAGREDRDQRRGVGGNRGRVRRMRRDRVGGADEPRAGAPGRDPGRGEPCHGANQRDGVRHRDRRADVLARLPGLRRRRPGARVPDRTAGRRVRSHAGRHAAHVPDGVLSRLHRDHVRGGAHRRPGAAAARPQPGVARDHDRGEPADLLPDPSVRVRPVLPAGGGAAGGDDGGHLPGHHPLRCHPARRPHHHRDLPGARDVASGDHLRGELGLRHRPRGERRRSRRGGSGVPARASRPRRSGTAGRTGA